MKCFDDKNTSIMVQSIASADTFVSSVVGCIKNYILSAFENKKYFKFIRMETANAFQEQNKARLYDKAINKIPYPSMSISPQLSLDNPVYGYKSPLISAPNNWLPRSMNRYFPTLLEDPDGKYNLFFSTDNTTMNVRFRIALNDFNDATRCGYWLHSRFNDGMVKTLSDQHIQVEIPKSIINNIARMENLFSSEDKYTNQEDLEKLDVLLAGLGERGTRIYRKKSLSTGKECYFYEEIENLTILFTDLEIPDVVSRDNSLESEYEITFRVQVTGYWVNTFMLAVNRAKIQTEDIVFDDGSNDNIPKTSSNTISSVLTRNIIVDKKNTIRFEDSDKEINIGQNIIHETFTANTKEPLKGLNLAYLLKPDLLKVYSYAKERNANLSKLLYAKTRAFSAGQPLVSEPQADYDNLYIDFGENGADSDIILDVFVNRTMFDGLLEDMQKDNFYKVKNALTTLNVNYYDDDNELVTEKIRVYSFSSNDEYYSTETSKALRIMTKYGIGYVGLVMEGTPNASNFKFCLGKDKYGNNIIRCLEKV